MKPRVLGIDFGTVRIGIAISDPLGMTAQPKPFIKQSETSFSEIIQLVNDYDIKTIVIGLPKHTRGGHTKKSEEVAEFSEKLKEHITIPIVFRDERFSTQAASKQLSVTGLNQKKQKTKIDSQAAAFVLQGYLDQI
ncbi:Holliday junction resolvase RuvX [Candidatus Marinamargulisbacteria bacterium SCGC AG-343-D04]|nr:Holliday junction resolvase RuvX [Candidatus Marinamargulisbacteria bacterium SCGC AG-343-D04]